MTRALLTIKARADAPDQTVLERTPFCILGATTRDTRRRIVDLAEERSLSGDNAACARARADLINPRNRIAAEVAWLPGLSPARANTYCHLLRSDLGQFLASAQNESPLVKANLIAAAIEWFDGANEPTVWITWIMDLADAADRVASDAVLRTLNEDRSVAGFPEILGIDAVEAELEARRRVYRDTIKDALDRIPSEAMIEVIAGLVDTATANGTRAGPILIDDVSEDVDAAVRPFLDQEAESSHRLIHVIRESENANEAVVDRLLDGLERVVRNWDRVARPIRVSMQVRGREHAPSRQLAYDIRELSVELVNIRGMVASAQRLTRLLQEVFAGLAGVTDRLEEDASTLGTLAEQQRTIEEHSAQWAHEITYEAEIGAVFKSRLRLSPAGVQWKDMRYPLESVTRIGWGGTRHSVNGIPTGTTYKILFGNDNGLSVVDLRDQKVYGDFIGRLWRAVGVRLVLELAENLRNGKRFHWGSGSALVDDRGIELSKRRLFRAEERVYATWDKVQVWSAEGSFYIGLKQDRATCVGFSYQEDNNAHVLEALIRAAFSQGVERLSDALSTSK